MPEPLSHQILSQVPAFLILLAVHSVLYVPLAMTLRKKPWVGVGLAVPSALILILAKAERADLFPDHQHWLFLLFIVSWVVAAFYLTTIIVKAFPELGSGKFSTSNVLAGFCTFPIINYVVGPIAVLFFWRKGRKTAKAKLASRVRFRRAQEGLTLQETEAGTADAFPFDHDVLAAYSSSKLAGLRLYRPKPNGTMLVHLVGEKAGYEIPPSDWLKVKELHQNTLPLANVGMIAIGILLIPTLAYLPVGLPLAAMFFRIAQQARKKRDIELLSRFGKPQESEGKIGGITLYILYILAQFVNKNGAGKPYFKDIIASSFGFFILVSGFMAINDLLIAIYTFDFDFIINITSYAGYVFGLYFFGFFFVGLLAFISEYVVLILWLVRHGRLPTAVDIVPHFQDIVEFERKLTEVG